MTGAGTATPAKELVSLADTTFSTGLIERSAAAFASSMPEGAGDDGFFGPASVTWRMSADLASPVAGLRSLLMQALHPLAMAGVDQHSGWRRDPVARLAATTAYLTTVTFGDRAAALRAAARVRRIHDHVRGTDAVQRPPVRGGRSRSAAVGARGAGRLRPGRREPARYRASRCCARTSRCGPPKTSPTPWGRWRAYMNPKWPIYIDKGLTPAVRQTLARLQDSVPPIPRARPRHGEDELAAPPEHAFARWDPCEV